MTVTISPKETAQLSKYPSLIFAAYYTEDMAYWYTEKDFYSHYKIKNFQFQLHLRGEVIITESCCLLDSM
jgi:hypothetical protein